MGEFSWDRNVEYPKMYSHLVGLLARERNKKRKYYLIVLLTQLRNGSRVGEAIDFINKIAIEGFERSGYVRVEKKKKPALRKMVLPKEISEEDIDDVRSIAIVFSKLSRKKRTRRVSDWARLNLGINTHSLRYSMITWLAKNGVSPSIIAKITGHSKLDYLIVYTQKKLAEEILEDDSIL